VPARQDDQQSHMDPECRVIWPRFPYSLPHGHRRRRALGTGNVFQQARAPERVAGVDPYPQGSGEQASALA